ncbi:PREDICTED: plant-specific TFIIB-related protein PTF2-like [Camelina sativa]|uniref:Plant-specific TFIIB-related protein PTF2-like n=1 Tax=Camelina sativa TaxID=90675 RepID=A0ABM0TVY9_CAMSA|nr:PREDICTED: plant-specific TFIIB-related protein PTF2-like [Camelina sativa]
MRCKRCNGSNLEREEGTGNSYCGGCGTLYEYDNYEAQLGGINGPQGTYIRVGTIGVGSVLAYKDKKIYEANKLIEVITERLNLGNNAETVKSMISKITDGEFGQGEWFPILIGACCYAVVRKEGKGVLPMEEIANEVGCELHQLGSVVKRVVDHLELELPEFDLVGLFMNTANNSSRLSDVDREKKERITKQGAFLMNCALKWFLSTGRKPMPLVVAVLNLVVQVNGVKVKIDDFAKDARVSLNTCKIRYRELLQRLVKVAEEVRLPWAKDVTVKNVVKHSGTLIGLMEAKSMRKRKHGTGDDLVRTDEFCLEDIVKDCLSKKPMYRDDDADDDDDHQGAMSRYFDVGGEHQLSICNNDGDISVKQLPTMSRCSSAGGENQLSLCHNNDDISVKQLPTMSRCSSLGGESELSVCNNDDNMLVKQLSTMYKEYVDGVWGGILGKISQGNNNSMLQKKSFFQMVSCEDWWKGRSKLSQRLLLKEVLEKDIGLDVFPPSYIKGCVAVERRREKIEKAKLRIHAIQHPSDIVSEGALSLELEHSKKRRKKGTEIDWEDLIIQTLVLHNVKDEEIEKGHYKSLLELHVFNCGEV